MEKYVFISHSSNDKQIANAICSWLENAGVVCWIAPRNIPPGTEFAGALAEAIDGCKILLVIFTSEADQSPHVRKEVMRAVDKDRIILPFRIHDTLPTKAMGYALNDIQWFDALPPPVKDHFSQLLESVKHLLALPGKPGGRGATPPKNTPDPTLASSLPYAPITGILIKDNTGTDLKICEFGIVYNPYEKNLLERSIRDCLIIERGSATQKIQWNLIESVVLQKPDDASVTFRGGSMFEHIKLRSGRIVGKDENGFLITIELSKVRKISMLRDTTVLELEALVRDIPILAGRTLKDSSYTCTFQLFPDQEGVFVTLGVFFKDKLQGTQSFQMPGPYKFWDDDECVNVIADKYYRLGRFNPLTATALTHALNRLNTILMEGKKQ